MTWRWTMLTFPARGIRFVASATLSSHGRQHGRGFFKYGLAAPANRRRLVQRSVVATEKA